MKNITITKDQYNQVKNVTAINCFAIARDIIANIFETDKESANDIIRAVYYNYKYLHVI